MNKTLRNIIISVAVIILLIAGIVIVNNIDVSDKSDTLSSQQPVYTIYSEDTTKISNIEVQNGAEIIKAVNLGDAVWTINDMSTDDIDSSKAAGLAGVVSSITSQNKIEQSPSDLSQYGLDNPDITVTITKTNGDKDKIYIGEMSPTLGEYFVMKDGDDTVYTLYEFKVTSLKQPLSYYQEFNRFDVDIDDINNIKIIRSDETIELNILEDIDKYTGNVWAMTAPYQSAANDDYIDDKILEPIDGIELTSPLENVDGGFSNASPVLILSVKPYDNLTGKYDDIYTETFTVGKTDGEKTYVKYKDKVYAVPSENISFVNESSFNIVSKMQALADISEIKSVTLEYGNSAHTMEIEQKNNEYSFKLNGNDADADVSQSIYKSIISLAIDGIYNGQQMTDTVLKITYEGEKDSDDIIIEFKSIDDLNCALVRNGKSEFTIKKNKLSEFIELFDTYAENPQQK